MRVQGGCPGRSDRPYRRSRMLDSGCGQMGFVAAVASTDDRHAAGLGVGQRAASTTDAGDRGLQASLPRYSLFSLRGGAGRGTAVPTRGAGAPGACSLRSVLVADWLEKGAAGILSFLVLITATRAFAWDHGRRWPRWRVRSRTHGPPALLDCDEATTAALRRLGPPGRSAVVPGSRSSHAYLEFTVSKNVIDS